MSQGAGLDIDPVARVTTRNRKHDYGREEEREDEETERNERERARERDQSSMAAEHRLINADNDSMNGINTFLRVPSGG